MLIIFFIVSVGLIGAWTMDVGVSGIGAGNANVVLSNGFWSINPAQGYHLGLFMVLGSLFGLALVSLRMAVDGR